jgi:hypothetical protein
MKTKLIQNEEIKTLLEQKVVIINEGKDLNVQIELKAEPIAAKFLSDKGVVEDGEAEETFGTNNKYKLYKGSYLKLQQAFRDSSIQVLQEQIKQELEEELNQLKSLELQVTSINEKINEVLKNEVVPTLGLAETEELTQIELKGIDIELTIVDVVEEYKQRYLEQKAKTSPEATQA